MRAVKPTKHKKTSEPAPLRGAAGSTSTRIRHTRSRRQSNPAARVLHARRLYSSQDMNSSLSISAVNGLSRPTYRRSTRRTSRKNLTVVSSKSPALHFDKEAYARVAESALVKDIEQYKALHERSVADPNAFWREIALENFYWETLPAENHVSFNFDIRKGPIFSKWFDGGRTNVAYNALDRHVEAGNGDRTAFIFEGNDPGRTYEMTYAEVLAEVSRVANWLRSVGVGKGDTVALYMPMVCELPIAMLACARIGAIHSVVFGGFSADALASRMVDCEAKVLITSTAVMRGKKAINLSHIAKEGLDIAAREGHRVPNVLVHRNTDPALDPALATLDGWDAGSFVFWHDDVASQSSSCDVEWMDAEDPLFLLYTSGSTGKPKGVLHTTAGYMVYAATTSRFTFAMQPGDVFWCTADCGWITGHTYLAYGVYLLACMFSNYFTHSLALGARSLPLQARSSPAQPMLSSRACPPTLLLPGAGR